jgi:hypothetical protein
VVYSEGSRTVGLIVDCIVDIVDESAGIDSFAVRSGVKGSYMADDCPTELLDLPGILRSAVPGLLPGAEFTASSG